MLEHVELNIFLIDIIAIILSLNKNTVKLSIKVIKMSDNLMEEKLAQYNEFFSIKHDFSINITLLEQNIPENFDQFLSSMPIPFKIASDLASIDPSALRSLQGLSSVANQLVDFLNQQSQKIDLLINYILSQQDEEEHRFRGIHFGGGGVSVSTTQPFALAQLLEMKVFLLQNNCAVFCIGEVIEIKQIKQQFHHKIIFHLIRDEDREILVRASLNEQSKHLQQLAKERNKK